MSQEWIGNRIDEARQQHAVAETVAGMLAERLENRLGERQLPAGELGALARSLLDLAEADAKKSDAG